MRNLKTHLVVWTRVEGELREIQQDVAPDAVLDEIEKTASYGHF